METVKNKPSLQETADQLYGRREIGLSSEALLKVIDPLIDSRLVTLFGQLRQCPPELGPLLDVRAQICEVWRVREALKEAKVKGLDAMKALEGLLMIVRKSDEQQNGNLQKH